MLIPTVIALSNFFVQNFPNISWYPYWYLGNPFNYLIGPLVPFSLLILNKAFFLPIPFAYFFLIFVSFLIGAWGLFVLIRSLEGKRREAILSSILFLIFPFSFYLLFFQNGLGHVTFGFLPWILVLFIKFLKEGSQKIALFLSIAIATVILIDTSILLRVLIGFIALAIVLRLERKRVEYILSLTVLIILAALSITTLWYTPQFWFIILSNPSFGGVPLIKLVQFLFQLLLQLLPIFLAVLFVKWRHLKPSKALLFGLLFFSSFFFLTIIRFLSDPDFIMDWIGFALELQFGGAIALGSLCGKTIDQIKIKDQRSNIKNANQKSKILIYASLVFLFIFGWLLVVRELRPALNKSEYQDRIISMLKIVPENERVFLSGSPVFFANSTLNISQVRGGMDEAAVHPFWAHGAFQIREGTSPELARDWLRALGVSYILVHGQNSSEPFHDFKHPEKFEKLELVDSQKRDNLYRAGGVSIGRIADKKILEIPSPKNGADGRTLASYIKTMKRPILLSFEKPNRIVISGDIGKNEVVSLAVSYHSNWHAEQGRALILKDSLGNMVIKPKVIGEQKISLTYSNRLWEYLIPGFFSLVFSLLILRFDKAYPYLSGPLSRLSFGIRGDDEDY